MEDPTLIVKQIDAGNIDLEDNTMDVVTISFGIRNCTDIQVQKFGRLYFHI
jgi:ubiquinone/menaquinone biosynthesis C-methylase UbiE